MGQIVGRAVMAIAKAQGSRVQVDLHTYAVVGAAAGLGGATRMTISITVLVMETTAGGLLRTSTRLLQRCIASSSSSSSSSRLYEHSL